MAQRKAERRPLGGGTARISDPARALVPRHDPRGVAEQRPLRLEQAQFHPALALSAGAPALVFEAVHCPAAAGAPHLLVRRRSGFPRGLSFLSALRLASADLP